MELLLTFLTDGLPQTVRLCHHSATKHFAFQRRRVKLGEEGRRMRPSELPETTVTEFGNEASLKMALHKESTRSENGISVGHKMRA